MLNRLILGAQFNHQVILGDLFSGHPLLSLGLQASTQNQLAPNLAGYSQNHNYRANLSQGSLYDLLGANHQMHFSSLILGKVIKEGRLFVTVTHSGVSQYMSNEPIASRSHFWQQQLAKLPQIQYQSAGAGGYIKIVWGRLSFLPQVFQDGAGALIKPPAQISVKAQWGWRDDRATLVFEGQATLRHFSEQGPEYDLWEPVYPQKALNEGMGYNATLAVTALVSNGATWTVTTGTVHNLAPAQEVLFQPTANGGPTWMAGKVKVASVPNSTTFTVNDPRTGAYGTTGAEVSSEIMPIPLVLGVVDYVPLVRTGFKSTFKYYRPNLAGLLGSGTYVYDDGIDISTTGWSTDNVSNPYLDRGATQVYGRATQKGTGSLASLWDLFVWGAAKLNLSLSATPPDGAESVMIDHVIKSQVQVIDLLDRVAGYCNFGFYIQAGLLTLFDRSVAHGNVGSIDSETDLFDLNYDYGLAAKLYKAKWKTAYAGVQGGIGGVPAVLDVTREVVVEGGSALGPEQTIQPYNQSEPLVRQQMIRIKAYREQVTVHLQAPLERLPRFSERIQTIDPLVTPPVSIDVKVDSFILDFESDMLTITAKGTVT